MIFFQPPSTRVARVLTAAASEPADGSENSWHQISSLRSAFSTNRSICEGGSVLNQRQDHPAGDAVVRPLDAGGGELLLDQQLFDGTGGATPPGLGPVRHDVPAGDQLVELRLLVELGEFGCVGTDLGAQLVSFSWQVQTVGPADARLGQGEHIGHRAVSAE